jgi:excinuclease UvrABC nuclease subunit
MKLNSPGVYVLWSKGKVVYVGQSKNMRSRIISHCHDKEGAPRKNFDSFQGFVIDKKFQRDFLEKQLIYELRPF